MIGWIERAITRRQWVIGLVAVLAGLLVPGLQRLTTDNSPEAFTVVGSTVSDEYAQFRSTFGSDRVVRLVAKGEIWTANGIAWWSELERRASRVEGVEAVIGPITVGGRLGFIADAETVDVEGLRKRLESSFLSRSFGWSTGDASLLSCLVVLEASGSSARTLEPLLELEQLSNSAPAEIEAEVVGLPMLRIELDRSAREIGFLHLPVLAAISLLVLISCLGRLRLAVMALLLVAGSLLTVHGLMGWTGHDLNLITSITAPLLFAIGLATSVHLLLEVNRCRQDVPEAATDAILAAFRNKGWAVFWSGATTIIGFGSLASSRVPPVRELGFWVSIGLVTVTLSAFIVLPALLAGIGPKASSMALTFEQRSRRLGRRLAILVTEFPRRVVLVAIGCGVLAACGLQFSSVETNALRYLPSDHPVRSSIQAVEDESIATASLELIFDRSSLPSTDSELVRWLEAFGAAIEEIPGVFSVSSAHTLLAELDSTFFGLVTLPVLRASPFGKEALRSFLVDSNASGDSGKVRVSVGTGVLDVAELDLLIQRVSEVSAGIPMVTTGRLLLLLETQRYLLSTMFRSGGVTIVLVTVLMVVMLGHVRLALLAMVPNLAALVVVFGSMGWFGSPLDIATVMVAATVLGLAVDYTIHSLCHFRQLEAEVGCRQALIRSLEITMPAYLLSGTVLLLGFSVCSLSSFTPVAHFGLYSAIAIATALFGVIVVLPALIFLTYREPPANPE